MVRTILLTAALAAAVACTAPINSGTSSSELSKGSRGATGPTGPQGATGATGPTGVADGLLPQSGTRLRAMRELRTGDDGSVQQEWVTTFFDTKLGLTCWLSPTADGQLRCLPVNGASMNLPYFADSGCATQVAVGFTSSIDGGSTQDPIGPFAFLGYFGASQRYFQLGSTYSGPLYQWNGQGGLDAGTASCEAAPQVDHLAWFVGAEMQPAEFVRFTTTKSRQ